ncbi:MAG: NnrS family protein, partial [Sphingomonadales bacterium]
MGTAAKRRAYQGPAFFSYGFRPFFFLSGVFSALAMLAWVLMFSGVWQPTQITDMLSWHVHEMLYGYLGAVVAGFLMTAIPNWTGRMPIMGRPLAALTILWVLGRFSLWLTGLGVLWSAVVDMGYFVLLASFIWREVISGRNWRNAPICVLVTLLTLGNLSFHLEAFGTFPPGLAQRLGLGVMAMLVAVIGGRITPAFTRNWMKQRGMTTLPAPTGTVDKIALALSVLGLGNWIAFPQAAQTPYLLLLAGAGLLIRLSRWKTFKTFAEPLVVILHIGYFWLGFSLVLMGLALGRSDI